MGLEAKSLAGFPIKSSVLDCFSQMRLFDPLAADEIGDGAGDLEDAGVAAGRKAEAVGDHFQQPPAGLVDRAELADMAGLHAGIGVQAEGSQPLVLDFPGTVDAGEDGAGRFGILGVGEVAMRYTGDFDVQIDAIEQAGQRGGCGNAAAGAECRNRYAERRRDSHRDRDSSLPPA